MISERQESVNFLEQYVVGKHFERKLKKELTHIGSGEETV
jgi:hypothetical protein